MIVVIVHRMKALYSDNEFKENRAGASDNKSCK